jgi:SAM-dependent methyltransferase
VPETANLTDIAEAMRRDWNQRARDDADRFVYTRDSEADERDFDESGRANFNQLVRPYLTVLLNGRDPRASRILEIGCGVGRMTRWFAGSFGEAHGVDVSPEMLERARRRLAAIPNVTLHPGSGFDLRPLPDAYFDLVFSYIVFQHIPSADVVRSYVREAARVLRDGGAFKFQVNGDQSADYRSHVRDTWQGETFSREEIAAMLADAGLSLETVEDPGTQYFVVTARKGAGPDPRTRFLPGEPADGGWRPAASRTTIRLFSENATKVYAGIYFWPSDPHPEHLVGMTMNGAPLAAHAVRQPGDHFLEWDLPRRTSGALEFLMTLEPACEERYSPALRIVGAR